LKINKFFGLTEIVGYVSEAVKINGNIKYYIYWKIK